MRCIICNEADYVFFGEQQYYTLYKCQNCSVIYSEYQNVRIDQGVSSVGFYGYSEEEFHSIPDLVSENIKILNPLLSYIKHIETRTFLEIGYGRGLSLIAASELGFREAIGVEHNSITFEETKKHFNTKANIYTFNDIRCVAALADVLFMWHTVEHLPDPNRFLEEITPRLNDGCVFYLQVPEYRPAYLCETHYFFYNETSLSRLLSQHNFTIMETGYDVANQFVSVIARLDR